MNKQGKYIRTKETKLKDSLALKEKWKDENWRNNQIKAIKQGHSKLQTKEKISKLQKKRWLNQASKYKIEQKFNKPINSILHELYWNKKLGLKEISNFLNIPISTVGMWFREFNIKTRSMSDIKKEQYQNPEIKEKMRNSKRRNWANKNYREKQLKAILKGLFKRPTSLEQKMIDFIQKHNLPFKYCGDGSILIGFKNPDFVENNGRKLCIEIANKVKFMHPDGWDIKRIEHFAKYGWKCLVLWEDELKNEDKLLEKIKKFMGSY